jgi:carbon-monoxide dehydrogenase large subunit
VTTVATPRAVGARVKRREDPRLLTGRGRYVDDVRSAGTLHVAFVRSPIAHGRITSIDYQEALAIPGVVAVFTADELPDRVRPMRSVCSGEGYWECDVPVLARDKVVMGGQAVAAVVAETRYLAEDGAELVFVDYEPLPVLASIDAALADGAPDIHPDVPGNTAVEFSASSGDVERAFAEADLVVDVETRSERACAVPLETRALLADFDSHSGELTIWATSQIPHLARTGFSRFLDIPENRIRVVSPDVGGGFGPKALVYPEDIAVAAISMALGRPVKWTSDRIEDLQTTAQGRGQVHRFQVAAASDGRVLGVKADIYADAGAYAPWPWGAATDVAQAQESFTGQYDIPNYDRTVHAVVTNKTPMGPYRGVGKVAACFSMERAIEAVAARLGLDPLEVRRRNVVRELPYWTAGGFRLESGDYAKSLDLLEEALDYDALRAEQATLREQGRYLGIGISCSIEQTAHGGQFLGGKGLGIVAGYDTAAMRIEPDGKVRVAVGLHSHGQGHETTIAQIASDELGVPVDDIEVVFGDTAVVPYGLGTWASRSTVYCGGATILAAQQVREQILSLAADMLEASADDLEIADAVIAVRGTPQRTLTVADVARRAIHEPHLLPPGVEPALEATRRYQAPNPGTFTNSVHAAVVDVDPQTGDVKILRYVVVEDCGRIINPTIVEGQIHGGVAQGIGGALLEQIVHDEDGQLLTANLMDYLLPGFMEVPRVEVIHMESPSPHTLGGFKGMGEGGAINAPAAVVGAVADALAPFGVVPNHTPVTPAWIVREVERARGEVSAS